MALVTNTAGTVATTMEPSTLAFEGVTLTIQSAGPSQPTVSFKDGRLQLSFQNYSGIIVLAPEDNSEGNIWWDVAHAADPPTLCGLPLSITRTRAAPPPPPFALQLKVASFTRACRARRCRWRSDRRPPRIRLRIRARWVAMTAAPP